MNHTFFIICRNKNKSVSCSFKFVRETEINLGHTVLTVKVFLFLPNILSKIYILLLLKRSLKEFN